MEASSRRLLDWPALLNARDLGGLPAGSGTTRFGAVVRSDSLHRLTDAGWAAFGAYGVTTVIDLRSESECRNFPCPASGLSGYRNLPFLDDAAMEQIAARFEVEGDNYLWQLEAGPRRIGAILTAIAGAPPGGVLVHCAAGKDRTGLVSALLLAIAGVDREAIVADYALTRAAMAAMLEEHLAREPDAARREQLRRGYRCRPELLARLLADLDRVHGGVAGYLRLAGVDGAARDRLRRRLTGTG